MKCLKLTGLLMSAALLLTGCSGLAPSKEPISYTDTLFDTVIRIQIYDTDDKDILTRCADMCREFENKFSTTIETSEVAMINAAGGNPVSVSDETAELIGKALHYSQLSKGAFRLTINPLSSLWDFKSDTPTVPDSEAITKALEHVSDDVVTVEGNTVTLSDPEASIDLGGIAKGYIADKLKAYLKDQGIKHALIDLGGNVLVLGDKPDGTDYNIGIQKPFDEQGQPITSVKIKDQSIVTSGTYQRCFEIDGKRYHHLLDPDTGYPCENVLNSVTIVADSSTTADALSTACFVLGPEKGMELVNSLDDVHAVFIDTENQITYSKNFQK